MDILDKIPQTREEITKEWIVAMLSTYFNEKIEVDGQLQVENVSKMGEHFASSLCRVTCDVRRNGKKEVISMVVKQKPINAIFNEMFSEQMDIFIREIVAYNEFLPDLNKFIVEKCKKEDVFPFQVPKCYYAKSTSNGAIIILEDLKLLQFSTPDIRKGLVEKEMFLAMEEIGKFHAITFAYQQSLGLKTLGEKYPSFETPCEVYDLDNTMPFITMGMEKALLICDAIPKTSRLTERLRKFVNDHSPLEKWIRETLNSSHADPLSTLIHGDFWLNNVMFHHSNKEADKVIVIDWQMIRANSTIAYDLNQFLLGCVRGEAREAIEESCLNAYKKAVEETFQRLNLPQMKNKFPLGMLGTILKKYRPVSCTIGLSLMPFVLGTGEEIPEDEKAFGEIGEDEMKKNISDVGKLTSEVVQFFEEIILEMEKNDVI